MFFPLKQRRGPIEAGMFFGGARQDARVSEQFAVFVSAMRIQDHMAELFRHSTLQDG